MDSVSITFLMTGGFLILLFGGMPVFGALGATSVVGILLAQGTRGLGAVPGVIFDRLAVFPLVAVPLFILMGEIIFHSGIGAGIFTATNRWLNRLPGSIGMASVAACAIFSALCGVSVAGAATIGSFAIPEMLRRGYDKSLATGCVAASGGLALLIPPSVALILYGVVGDESVGRLFIAGIVPGIVLAGLMMGFIFIVGIVRPDLAPKNDEAVTWAMRFQAVVQIWPAVLLIILVLGSIYQGIATPTEAASVGCVGALIIAYFRKQLDWMKFRTILRSTISTSAMIMLIFASALLFGYVLTRLQVPQEFASYVATLDMPNWVILLCIFLLIYVMGMFMDVVSVILISTPILLPIILQMGYSSLWFGIVMAIACEIGTATPPVGLNLYVIKGVSPPSVSLMNIICGAIPFVLVETFGLAIFLLFPDLVLWLPNLIK